MAMLATRSRYASGERCFQQGRGENVTVSEVAFLAPGEAWEGRKDK
jgi:hypothetical protein